MKNLVILLFALLLRLSSSAQCNAYFQFYFNSSTDEFEFTPVCTYDTSIHPIIYQWDMGDGTTEYGENPTHHYASANNYLVCLILYVGNGAGCCQDTFCEMIDFVPANVNNNQQWISEVSINTLGKNVSLHLTLPKTQTLKINVVTLNGQMIPVRLSQAIPQGRNEIDFSMPDYPSGIYLLRMEDEAGNAVARRFMLF